MKKIRYKGARALAKLIEQGKCNNMDGEQIVRDLSLCNSDHFNSFFIMSNDTWFDTIYLDPIEDDTGYTYTLSIALALAWKADQIQWVPRNMRNRRYTPVKAYPIGVARPMDSILRVWWD